MFLFEKQKITIERNNNFICFFVNGKEVDLKIILKKDRTESKINKLWDKYKREQLKKFEKLVKSVIKMLNNELYYYKEIIVQKIASALIKGSE